MEPMSIKHPKSMPELVDRAAMLLAEEMEKVIAANTALMIISEAPSNTSEADLKQIAKSHLSKLSKGDLCSAKIKFFMDKSKELWNQTT